MSAAGLTQQVAEWVVSTNFDALPRRVVEEAKNQILSMVAAAHSGHFADVGRALRRTTKDWGVAKDATVIPSGDRMTLHSALFTNCALASVLEYDDFLFAGHTGHAAVLAPLALAESVGAAGKDLIVAQVIANEIGGRVGAAQAHRDVPTQALSGVHVAAAAAGGAKLLGLDVDGVRAALGFAFSQLGTVLDRPYFASDARVYSTASQVVAGVQAAQLAANGVRGDLHVLDGNGDGAEHGALSLPLVREGFASLGSAWLTETLCYKVYPLCIGLGTVVDCVLDMGRQQPIDAKRVKSVSVAASPLTLDLNERVAPLVAGPHTPPAVLAYYAPYAVAAAITDRELTARQLNADRTSDEALWALAAKVQLAHDDVLAQRAAMAWLARSSKGGEERRTTVDFNPLHVSQFRMSAGARVRIELEDGRSFEAEEEVPEGSAGRAYDDRRKAVEDKFRRETRYTLRKEKMEKAVDVILHIEGASAANLRELVRLCCSERA